jgi:hypothetical protein
MSYQFHHKDPYGRRAGKGAKSSFNAQDIADEAERKPSACRHVREPKPPTLLFGVMPSDAVKKSYEWAAKAKDKIGRKLRPDGLCIVAGMVSVPDGFDRWDDYKKAVIADLLAQHGDRLLSVVEHTDEAYPHMHYYMVPRAGERLEILHEGLAARNALRDAKKPTGEQNIAYREAMEKFQTDFHEQVSSKFGLLRDGPKRERLSTPEWRVAKAAAKRDAAMMRETEVQCQAMTLAALEASANQSAAERADALAQLKIEMENLRATTARECDLKTKAEMDKAKAETQAAAIKLAEAEASGAEYRAKLIAGGEAYIARETARGKKLTDAARNKGYAEGKAEAAAKWGGVAGAVSVIKEVIAGDKADAVAELEAKHEAEKQRDDTTISRLHAAALEAKQVASIAEQCSQQDRAALVTEKEKTAELEKRLHEFEHPQQRQQQRQDNAPAPGY